MGMIGGGKDAFIGAIHRFAFNMDAQIEIVAGALSINPEIAVDSGKSLFLDESRIYTDYKVMLKKKLQCQKINELILSASLLPTSCILIRL